MSGEAKKKNDPHFLRRGPSGGLVDIDQEVVTLRGPFGTIPGPDTTTAGRSDSLIRQPNSG